MSRSLRLNKYLSSFVIILMIMSLFIVQVPMALAKTLQTPIPNPSNDTVVLNVAIGGVTLPYTWGDLTGATGYKFAGKATSDSYLAANPHDICYGLKFADLLTNIESRLGITLQDTYNIKAVASDAYVNSPFTVAEARDDANHYLLANKVNDVSESCVGYKDSDPSVTYPATYLRIARNRGGDYSTDQFGNTAYLRLISSLQITKSDNSAVELPNADPAQNNGVGLDKLKPAPAGLVIGGSGISKGSGLLGSLVYLSQDQVDSIKANKSVAGLGLGNSWTSTPVLYSSYDDHGTPEYVYTLAEGINLKTALTALGADVTSAPVALEATGNDAYAKIVDDAFGIAASRNYIAPDGTVGAAVDPILVFYANEVQTSTPSAGTVLPTTTSAITDTNPLFAYGQKTATEQTNCSFIKNTVKLRVGLDTPAFTLTSDSGTKSISLSDIALLGLYQTSYIWNNNGTQVTQSVQGVPLSVLLSKLGVAVGNGKGLAITVNDGSGSVQSSRTISSDEIGKCFIAYDVLENGQRVSGTKTPLRLYCPGETSASVLVENVVGAAVSNVVSNYTVSFEENGGSTVADITQASGTTIATAPVSTRAGYTLEGWYTDAGLTNKVTFPYMLSSSVTLYANWTAESQDNGGSKAPGGDVGNSVFYIAVKDTPSGDTKYYYYTKAELQAHETQQSYTYNDHSVIKTVTCKGALLDDLLKDLQGVSLTDDMIVQYAEEDAYHADPTTAVVNSNYKDTITSLTQATISGSGSTKNPMRSMITYAIHEEYANPDANNVNDPAGVFKDADNNSGFLRAYRDTADANSAVLKYMIGVVVSTDGALLTGNNGCVVTCVSDKNPTIKVIDDATIKGLLPGMQYAVKAPTVTNAALADGEANPAVITVGSGLPTATVITFKYTEGTYFSVKNNLTDSTENYTYTDFKAKGVQVPDAATNSAPYGYSRPMYYRYNGIWLSDLAGKSDNCTITLVGKDGTKIDVTDKIDQYFVAYNNTQSKTSTNIPESKRVTIAYNEAKVIIPSTGVNITGSSSTDYTTAGNDVTVLLAAAEGLEITPKNDNPTYQYTITPEDNPAYTKGATTDGIKTMTVNSGINGLEYFTVDISPVQAHSGLETVVFVHLRGGSQLELNATKADFDSIKTAAAGFNVQAGDVVKAYMVDDLTNALDSNPTIFQ